MATKGYNFFLGSLQLPIPPESIETVINNQNTTINLINDQEVNILRKAGLSEINFEALIPQVKYPFASYPNGFKSASYFLEQFEKLKTGLKPFQLIITRAMPNGKPLFDTNLKVSLENYTVKEEAENGFDLVVSFNFKQYVEFATKTVKIKIDDNRKKPVITPKPPKRAASSSTKKNIKPTIGCNVIVNGRLHRDSYGSAPGQTRENYKGKINFINTKGTHPYHVTTPNGGWLGWVLPDAIVVI